jgi:DNA mismatch repair ATPase MutL
MLSHSPKCLRLSSDLEELIHLMQDRPGGQMVRCSKARAMFAMRACRKSVMVGMPLTKGQMTSVSFQPIETPFNHPDWEIHIKGRPAHGNYGSTMELPSW